LRSYSPITTIGGGIIIDPLPVKHKRNNSEVISKLNILKEGELAEKIIVILERTGFLGINLRGLAFRLGVNTRKIRDELDSLFSRKKAILLDAEDTTVVSSFFYKKTEELITGALMAYHKKNPLQAGISKEELKETIGHDVPAKLYNLALRGLGKKETIVSDKDSVRLARHQVEMTDGLDTLRDTIAAKYKEAGLNVPALGDVITSFQNEKARAQSIIKLMLKDGELVKINEELCFDRDVLAKLRNDYKALLIKDGKATPASFKDLTGLSRKYLIPLMEYFDMNKLTVRVGDHRILREKTT